MRKLIVYSLFFLFVLSLNLPAGVKASVLSSTPQQGTVNQKDVNIKKGPDLNEKTICRIPRKGTSVKVLSREGDWFKVKLGSCEGWILGTYLTTDSGAPALGQEQEKPGTAQNEPVAPKAADDFVLFPTPKKGTVIKNRVDVKNGPDVKEKTLCRVYVPSDYSKYVSLQVLGRQGDWFKVKMGTCVGWIQSSFITLAEVAPEEKKEMAIASVSQEEALAAREAKEKEEALRKQKEEQERIVALTKQKEEAARQEALRKKQKEEQERIEALKRQKEAEEKAVEVEGMEVFSTPKKGIVNKNKVDIKSRPDIKEKTLCRVYVPPDYSKDISLLVLGQKDDWFKVKMGSCVGWIQAAYVDLEDVVLVRKEKEKEEDLRKQKEEQERLVALTKQKEAAARQEEEALKKEKAEKERLEALRQQQEEVARQEALRKEQQEQERLAALDKQKAEEARQEALRKQKEEAERLEALRRQKEAEKRAAEAKGLVLFPSPRQGIVVNKKVDLKKGPDQKEKTICRVYVPADYAMDISVMVLGRQDGWYKVRMGSCVGWIEETYVTLKPVAPEAEREMVAAAPTPPETVQPTVAEPAITEEEIAQPEKPAPRRLAEPSVLFSTPGKGIEGDKRVNLREGPDVKNKTVCRIYVPASSVKDTWVRVLEQEGDWYKIKLGSCEGWVEGSYLAISRKGPVLAKKELEEQAVEKEKAEQERLEALKKQEEASRQEALRKQKEEEERLAALKKQEEQVARQEALRKEKEEAERLEALRRQKEEEKRVAEAKGLVAFSTPQKGLVSTSQFELKKMPGTKEKTLCNIYVPPDHAKEISVMVLGQQDDWYRVRVGSCVGWIQSAYVTIEEAAPAKEEKVMVAVVPGVKPEIKPEVKAVEPEAAEPAVKEETVVEPEEKVAEPEEATRQEALRKEKEEQERVEALRKQKEEEKMAAEAKGLVAFSTPQKGVVSTNQFDLKKMPGPGEKTLCKVYVPSDHAREISVMVLGRQDDWYRVRVGTCVGWIPSTLVTLKEAAPAKEEKVMVAVVPGVKPEIKPEIKAVEPAAIEPAVKEEAVVEPEEKAAAPEEAVEPEAEVKAPEEVVEPEEKVAAPEEVVEPEEKVAAPEEVVEPEEEVAAPKEKAKAPKLAGAFVKDFTFSGNTLVDTETLKKLAEPFKKCRQMTEDELNELNDLIAKNDPEKRYLIPKADVCDEVTIEEMNELADMVTMTYQEDGYILAKAYLPAQELQDNILNISVLEGNVGKIEVAGNKYYSDRVLKRYFKPQERAGVVKESYLEKGLLFTNELQKAETALVLQKGEKPGDVNLVLNTKDSFAADLKLDYNNYGIDEVSDHRYGISFKITDPFWGSIFKIRGVTGNTLEDSTLVISDLTVPINSYGTTIGGSYIKSGFVLGQELAFTGLLGMSEIYGGRISHPLIKDRSMNLYLTLGYDHKYSENEIEGAGLLAIDKLDEYYARADFDNIDRFLGKNVFSAEYYVGDVDEFTYPRPSDFNGDTQFKRLVLSAARVQKVYGYTNLLVRARGQITKDRLPPVDKFVIGGYGTVRGHDPALRLADSGYNLSAELMFAPPFVAEKTLFNQRIAQMVQFAIFLEHGGVYTTDPIEKSQETRNEYLTGFGGGIRIFYKDIFTFKYDIAFPTNQHEEDGEPEIFNYFQFSLNIF